MVQDGAFHVKRSESSRRRYKRRDESVARVSSSSRVIPESKKERERENRELVRESSGFGYLFSNSSSSSCSCISVKVDSEGE